MTWDCRAGGRRWGRLSAGLLLALAGMLATSGCERDSSPAVPEMTVSPSSDRTGEPTPSGEGDPDSPPTPSSEPGGQPQSPPTEPIPVPAPTTCTGAASDPAACTEAPTAPK